MNAIPINDIIVRNRTILALFKPADLATTGPQVIYEEGGIIQGVVLKLSATDIPFHKISYGTVVTTSVVVDAL